MVTVLNYRWLASPWECFYSRSTVIGRWAVCAAWQSAAFRVIVSLGSSAEGQDRIPELPEVASSLFRPNHFLFGKYTKRELHGALLSSLLHNLSWKSESESGGETSRRGCRHHGESDERSRAWSPGFYYAAHQFRIFQAAILAQPWCLSGYLHAILPRQLLLTFACYISHKVV